MSHDLQVWIRADAGSYIWCTQDNYIWMLDEENLEAKLYAHINGEDE